MFKIPKRCEFCAHKLDKNGNCENTGCIAYVAPNAAGSDTTTKEADK